MLHSGLEARIHTFEENVERWRHGELERSAAHLAKIFISKLWLLPAPLCLHDAITLLVPIGQLAELPSTTTSFLALKWVVTSDRDNYSSRRNSGYNLGAYNPPPQQSNLPSPYLVTLWGPITCCLIRTTRCLAVFVVRPLRCTIPAACRFTLRLVASSVNLFIASCIHDGVPLAGLRLFAIQVPNIAPRALNKPSSDPVWWASLTTLLPWFI